MHRRILMISSEEKRKRQSKDREGKVSWFAFTFFYCNWDQQKSIMIDSGRKRLIRNAHKTSQPMIIAIWLCTHCILPHHTKVYSGKSGPLNWLCIFFYSFKFSFHTSCGTQIHLILTSCLHKQIFAWPLSIVYMGVDVCRYFSFFLFKEKVSINKVDEKVRFACAARMYFIFFSCLAICLN